MRFRPRSARRLGQFLLAVVLIGVPAAAPSPVAGIGPLPECRFDDILTEPREYDDGPITLVDHLLTLGKDYEPPDLISVGEMGLAGGGLIRRIAAEDTRAMARAAADNGTPIGAWSAYRTYRSQRQLYRDGVAAYGVDVASIYWARPGHSEHQLGLGVDFMTAGGGSPLIGDWSTTPAGAWMKENAWMYGWVMSYPKGKKSITCFHYEPWHYRYVGREVAAAIHDSGLTTREHLWANFTQVDLSTGEPVPSPSASVAPSVPSPATAGPSTGANETPGPTEPRGLPPSEPGGLLGLDSPIAILAIVVAIAAVGLIALGLRRSRA